MIFAANQPGLGQGRNKREAARRRLGRLDTTTRRASLDFAIRPFSGSLPLAVNPPPDPASGLGGVKRRRASGTEQR
jgi:hypothetical protein